MRSEKLSIVGEIRSQLQQGEFVILANYQGLSVKNLTDLRHKLRDNKAELHVVSNAFFGLAAKDLGWRGVDVLLQGPSAMIVGGGDVTVTAKTLKDYAKLNVKLVLKGGVMGASVLSAADVDALASLPARAVMLAQFVGTLAAPLRSTVSVLNAKVLSLLYALQAAEAKKKGE